jgi:hypothetical protein
VKWGWNKRITLKFQIPTFIQWSRRIKILKLMQYGLVQMLTKTEIFFGLQEMPSNRGCRGAGKYIRSKAHQKRCFISILVRENRFGIIHSTIISNGCFKGNGRKKEARESAPI